MKKLFCLFFLIFFALSGMQLPEAKRQKTHGAMSAHSMPLIQASRDGDAAAVAKLIKEKAPFNEQDSDGYTALMRAAEAGHLAIVEQLLQAGANEKIKNRYGQTALAIAQIAAAKPGANADYKTIVNLLEWLNVTGEAQQKPGAGQSLLEGMPPEILEIILMRLVALAPDMHHAIEQIRNFANTSASLRQLIEMESVQGKLIKDLAQRYTRGYLFDAARALGYKQSICWFSSRIQRLIQEKKITDAHKLEEQMYGNFYASVNNGDSATIAFIVQCPYFAQKFVNKPYYYLFRGQRIILFPLIKAVELNNENLARVLVQAGARVNEESPDGKIALVEAAAHSDPALVKLLLAAPGINVNSVNKMGSTPLTSAILGVTLFQHNPAHGLIIIDQLLAAGANVNQADKEGETPLMNAVKFYNYEIIERLLRVPGIQVNAQDAQGRTALSGMISPFAGSVREDEQIIRALLKAGADPNLPDKNGITPFMAAKEIYSREFREKIIKLLQEFGAK